MAVKFRVITPALLLLVPIAFPGVCVGQGKVIDLPNNVDEARNRNVPIAIHLPSSAKAQPLVIVSHGGAGSRHGLFALAAELSEQGYVVACLEHVTSNTDNIRERMRSKRLGFRDALRDVAKDEIPRKNRPLDVRFALDLIEQLNRNDERFSGRVDMDKVAMLGHSYGAYTTLVCCGVKPVGIDDNLVEPRIKIGIGMSPQSASGLFFDETSFTGVTLPFVGISGTKDLAGEGHKDFLRLMPAGDKHLIWFHGANHFSFSDPTGGPRRAIRPDRDVTRSLKIMVPKILDAYLRDGPRLDEATRSGLIKQSLGGTVRRIEWKTN